MSREDSDPPVASLMQSMSSSWLLTDTLQHCIEVYREPTVNSGNLLQQPTETLVTADHRGLFFEGCSGFLPPTSSVPAMDEFGADDLRVRW